MSGLLLLRRPTHVRCLSSRLSQVRTYGLIGKPMSNIEPKWVLPKTPARTRFAPSPTGYLHLGSLRTALYNYLLAQATGGQFILRLEDTDRARLVSDAEQVLYDDLRWAGLHWDEGPDKGGPFGPYRQSERLELYVQHAKALLESGHAFRCFCSKQELEYNLAQATAHGGAAHYPGTCTHVELGESDRRAANGEPHVIRFKAAETPVTALDLVYGPYKKAEREDSFIIMKSDGFPTYHFANVVDDHFMDITHVIRGAEWLISTPKHVELYNAFGWQPPNFAHVGLLVDPQRQKLSKRMMSNIGISVYRSNNIIPEALLNFSALLGWDPNLQRNTHLDKKGVMTLDEMKQNFTLKFTRGDIVVDLAKFKFFQSKMTSKLILGETADHATLSEKFLQPIMTELKKLDERLRDYLENGKIDDDPDLQTVIESLAPRPVEPALTEDYILQVLKARKGPVDDPAQFLFNNLWAFYRPSKKAMRETYHKLEGSMAKVMILKGDTKLLNSDISKVLKVFTRGLKALDPEDWNSEKLGDIVKLLVDSVKFYDTVANKDKYESAGWKFLRHALLNGKSGLAILPMMRLLGQAETVDRIRSARKIASHQEDRAERARTQERQEEEAAAKVRIRDPTDALLGTEAKHPAATRTKDRDPEFRNVKIRELKGKAPTPPGLGAFSIYVDGTKGRGAEGPFKSLPPRPPPPPKSPPRDSSEVERAPQFLSPREFKSGIRRIEEADRVDAAFLNIEELQAELRVQNRALQAMEDRAVAEERSKRGGWVVPKTMFSREEQTAGGPPEGQGAFFAGDPLPVDYNEHVKHIAKVNREAPTLAAIRKQQAEISERRRSLISVEAPLGPMYSGSAIGGTPRDLIARHSESALFRAQVNDELPTDRQSSVEHIAFTPQDIAARDSSPRAAKREADQVRTLKDEDRASSQDEERAKDEARASLRDRQNIRKSTPGHFKPAGTSPLSNVTKHIQHLRALNRAMAVRKASEKRTASEEGRLRRLDALKASGELSPLSQQAVVKGRPLGLGPPGGGDGSRRDAKMPALNSGETVDRAEPLFRNAWETDSDLGFAEKRRAAADSRVKNEIRREEEAASVRLEREMARQWAARHE